MMERRAKYVSGVLVILSVYGLIVGLHLLMGESMSEALGLQDVAIGILACWFVGALAIRRGRRSRGSTDDDRTKGRTRSSGLEEPGVDGS
jgi:hypothetical protein